MTRRALFRPDRSVPFVDTVYLAIAGKKSIEEVATELRTIEARHHVFLSPADGLDGAVIPEEAWSARVSQHLHPFLDDTHFVLAGQDWRNDYDMRDAGREIGLSFRGWGAIVAAWANLRGWPPNTPARTWDYTAFSWMGPPMLDYDDFAHVVLRAIDLSYRSKRG